MATNGTLGRRGIARPDRGFASDPLGHRRHREDRLRLHPGPRVAPRLEVIAVGSRTQEGADRFAFEHEIPHRHGSYESLANDADVDVVYIGTPHSRTATTRCSADGEGGVEGVAVGAFEVADSRQSPIVRTGTPALRSASRQARVSGTSPDVMITVSARTFSSASP